MRRLSSAIRPVCSKRAIVLALVVYIYLDWRNDHLLVSNKRVVHEDTTLWLSYRYETIPLDRIQNVNIRTDNVFQYVLKYGRVEVQAAGEQRD